MEWYKNSGYRFDLAFRTCFKMSSSQKIAVRVMHDPKNKRTFKNFNIDFPIMTSVKETVKLLMDTYSELLGFRTPDNAEIGYIGYSNKKLKIENESDLKEAFASGSMHKFDTPVFYICMRTDNEIGKGEVDLFFNSFSVQFY